MKKNQTAKQAPAPSPSKGSDVDDASVQALFEEIDSEVKAKQVEGFLKKHGVAIAIAMLTVVLGTAAGSTYMKMQMQDSENATRSLITMMDKDFAALSDDAAKATILDMQKMGTEEKSAGHRMVANLAAAGTLLANGKNEEAIKILDMVRNDKSIKPMYQDYALLLSVRARTGTDDAKKLLSELSLLLEPNNPWYLSALEAAAVLQARAGEKDKALLSLQTIMETADASQAAVERAKTLARLYRQ